MASPWAMLGHPQQDLRMFDDDLFCTPQNSKQNCVGARRICQQTTTCWVARGNVVFFFLGCAVYIANMDAETLNSAGIVFFFDTQVVPKDECISFCIHVIHLPKIVMRLVIWMYDQSIVLSTLA